MNKRQRELCMCAIEQGFTKDLRPTFKHPAINIIFFFTIIEILKEEERKGKRRRLISRKAIKKFFER